MKKITLYKSAFFTLSRVHSKKNMELEMIVHSPIVNTKYLQNTIQFIEHHCPSVLTTDCFNDSNLPFRIEVKQTEIAHLLEHIVLDELCALEITKGADTAGYSGRTYWNWMREPSGTFHISFDVPKEETAFFQALEKGVQIIENLFLNQKAQRVDITLPAGLSN